MNWFVLSLLVFMTLLVLDATVGRLLLKLKSTYRKTTAPGGTPESKRLLVYLPGILFDGDESVTEIKESMLKPVMGGMFISYGFWRFLPRHVLRKTAADIGHASQNNGGQPYASVVLVGASFGGRLAADLALKLQTVYGWEASAIKVVMVDTPCENNSFQRPGLTVSLIMRWLYFGPLISALIAPVLKKGLVPPYDVDIEPGLDPTSVKRNAVDRMAKFRLSSTADQQRYLADDNIQWTMGLTGIDVTYLWCDHNNITVVQPAAMRKVELFTRGKVARFSWRSVPSPHCGFSQLPSLWGDVFNEVLTKLPQSQT